MMSTEDRKRVRTGPRKECGLRGLERAESVPVETMDTTSAIQL